MSLAICHREGERAILDAIREVKPPFSPESVVAEFCALLKTYRINTVIGDKYAGQWPAERFQVHHISYIGAAKPKSDLYRDFLPAVNGRRVELLDHSKLISQLCGLERRTWRGGRDSIDHAPNQHDDVVNCVAGALTNLIVVEAPQPVFGFYSSSGRGWNGAHYVGDDNEAGAPPTRVSRPNIGPRKEFFIRAMKKCGLLAVSGNRNRQRRNRHEHSKFTTPAARTGSPVEGAVGASLGRRRNIRGRCSIPAAGQEFSPEGRDNQRHAKLRAAIRDLRDARAPIDEMQKRLDQKRKAVAMPKFDPNDTIGFLRRQELRQALRSTTDRGARALLLQQPEFIDAMLEQPAILSGLLPTEQFLIELHKGNAAENSLRPAIGRNRLARRVIAEARAITGVAYNDLKAKSGMPEHAFNELVEPIEARKNAPWLKRSVEDGQEWFA